MFIQGGWDDLDRLPVLSPAALPLVNHQAPRIQEGERNNTLWRYCMAQARHCDTLDALLDVARTYAEDALDLIGRTHRLTDAEITSAAMSAWRHEIEGRNLFGRGGATILPHEPIDKLGNRSRCLGALRDPATSPQRRRGIRSGKRNSQQRWVQRRTRSARRSLAWPSTA